MVNEFGWTEIMEELTYSNYHFLIIPTVLIPLTMISMGISVVATFIAGLFGVKLKNEGPKRLLELLLKPRILISAVILNFVILGGSWGYKYVKNLPTFMFNIERNNNAIGNVVVDTKYKPVHESVNIYTGSKINPLSPKVQLSKQVVLDGGVFRAGALTEDSLFIGTSKGYVYEIERETLKTKRKFYTGTFVTPSPLIWKNKLVFGEGVHKTHHARVYFFDLKTNKLEKYFTSKGHTEGQGTFASYTENGRTHERMIVIAGGDGIYSVDPNSMVVKWHNIDGHNDASAIIKGKYVFVGTGREKGDAKKYRTYALAYDFLTGKTIWKRELPASSWMKPTLTKTDVCFIYGEIYFKSEVGGMQCFNQVSGLPTQTYAQLAPIASIPITLNNDIIFADSLGNVCRVDTQKHKIIWCQKTHDSKKMTYSSVRYDKYRNLLTYSSQKNGFYLLHPDSGKILSHWLPEGGVAKTVKGKKKNVELNKRQWNKSYASPVSTKEGWYVVDMKGILRLLKPKTLLSNKTKKTAQ